MCVFGFAQKLTSILSMEIFVGWPGSVRDSRLLRNSSLCSLAESGLLMPEGYFFVGDSGYALLDWMMIPFPSSANAEPYESTFDFFCPFVNKNHCQAFGRLKMRWRVLLREQQESPTTATNVAVACMVLHNLASTSPDSAFRSSWSTTVPHIGSSSSLQQNAGSATAVRCQNIAEALENGNL